MTTNYKDILQFALKMPALLENLGDLDPHGIVHFFPDAEFVAHACARLMGSPHQWYQVFNHSAHKPLGRHFERIVHASLLAGFPDCNIAANVQLRSKHQPGELDFVIADLSATIHLEVAIKFYLFVPAPLPCTSNFHGPQLRDRLDLKLEKLVLKQLRHQIPDDVLSPNLNAPIRRALWLTGMLFYPARDYLRQNFPNFVPMGINPFHLKGWWCDEGELSQVFAQPNHRFLTLVKQQWIDPLNGVHFLSAPYAEQLLPIEQPATFTEPQLVLRIDQDGRAIDRGFIVPRGWGPHLPPSR